MSDPVAFVIPWFGADLIGGGEQHVFQVATRLAQRGHAVEVLTTCCRSHKSSWYENHHPEGASREHGLLVRRFAVRAGDRAAFDAANAALLAFNDQPKLPGTCPVPESEYRAFVEENIRSPKLLEHLRRDGTKYRAVVFALYPYGPTLSGVPLCGARSVLQPLLHDETYAYLPHVADAFHAAAKILFISEGEAALAARLFGPAMLRKGTVAGAGVEAPASDRIEPIASLASSPYVLYLGRRDPRKNVGLLVRAFQAYRSRNPDSQLRLALAGPGDLSFCAGSLDGVADVGVVSEPQATWLLRNCAALAQPSRNESYSRSMMEAWMQGRPVVVHSECLATSIPVSRSGGGWAAASDEEWEQALAAVDAADARERAARGDRGRTYARVHADWDKAIDRYEEALGLRAAPRPRSARRKRRQAIHQLMPNLSYGDAISNQATFIRELLVELGYESEIFVRYIDERMTALGRPYAPGLIRSGDAVVYHHSIGSEITEVAIRHPGPKALVYHNITPASFFERWDPSFAKLLADGRRDLRDLARSFPLAAGVSEYNSAELREAGFERPLVLPIFVDPLRWDAAPDPGWMKALQDGRTNLLFAGRIAPSKCQHDLLDAFKEYLAFDPDARLLLVGRWQDGDPYARHLRERTQALGIESSVLTLRHATDAQLHACYRTAHLFWSMSEHEGFCVPLVEAMWFDVPVLAFRSSAVPETLGHAGMMFTEKKPAEVAALAHLLVENRDLRGKIVAAQRARREDFLPSAVLPKFLRLIDALDGDVAVRAAS